MTRDEELKRGRERWQRAYAADPGKFKRRAAASRKACTQRLQELRDGLACMWCGEADPVVLDFHHRDPATKSFDISAAGNRCRQWEQVEAELLKCDVLCCNCHRKLHASERANG